MKKFSFLLIFFFVLSYNSLLKAYSSNPNDFVFELVTDIITKLSSKDINDDEKKIFIENIALENVDIRALGLYTLGEIRKSADKEDIKNYEKTFQKYFYLIIRIVYYYGYCCNYN